MDAAANELARRAEEAAAAVAARVHPWRQNLRAEVLQTSEPVPVRTARGAVYRGVEPGWRWGPVWSSCWFRLRGRMPKGEGGEVWLRFSSGTEAMLWDGEEPSHGLDENHELAPVRGGGGDVELMVEAACNRPLGATTFFWDRPEEVARWKEELPGKFEFAELVTVDWAAWSLRRTLLFAAGVLRVGGVSERFVAGLERGVEAVARGGPDAEVEAGLREAMRGEDDGLSACHAVGHAHIDTAWLWPMRETRRKCLRTFSTALGLIERFGGDGFTFLCGQAQQYAWVERDAPGLFAKMKIEVERGRWEPFGAVWVEPDANLPSGESLIRQVLHGLWYWRERFGAGSGGAPQQRCLYLPDTFGFPASLPQIIVQAGLDTFITNKLGWNDTNEFPHSTFRWRGIDGTEVLSHCTPGMEYNSTMTPAELRKGDANHRRKEAGRTASWLQPFGYGDGGGGPTDWMVHAAGLAAACEGMPRVRLSSTRAFCEALHNESAGETLPVWDGELYLERHRGTYTTQAWIKAANLEMEESLRRAEWLGVAGPQVGSAGVRERLNEAWKEVLTQQFHDILPGSSVGEVYEESRGVYARVRARVQEVEREGLAGWVSGPGAVVLNPASGVRGGVVEVEGQERYIAAVPGMGMAAAEGSAPPGMVRVRDGELSNGVIRVTIDRAGRVVGLAREGAAELSGAVNVLTVFDDTPKYWEAWDIDDGYQASARPVEGDAQEWEVVRDSGLRGAVRVARRIGERSRIEQTFELAAGSPRLDVHTRVEWRESRTLLRAMFPTGIAAREAVCGIQFGHITRPAHREDSRARAMYEFCAHRWCDVSQAGRGFALLTKGKYGHSCDGGTMGLSLLRSTKFPDPDADMGVHEFTYSLMPHGGNWRTAGVDAEAEALNRPLTASEGALASGAWAPLRIEAEPGSLARIEIASIKPAEEGDRFVVRLVEVRGIAAIVRVSWGLNIARVESVDVAERPRPSVMLRLSDRCTEFAIRPFEIVSLLVERA